MGIDIRKKRWKKQQSCGKDEESTGRSRSSIEECVGRNEVASR